MYIYIYMYIYIPIALSAGRTLLSLGSATESERGTQEEVCYSDRRVETETVVQSESQHQSH